MSAEGDGAARARGLRLPPLVWWTRGPVAEGEAGTGRRARNFLGLLYHQVAESPDGAGPSRGLRRAGLRRLLRARSSREPRAAERGAADAVGHEVTGRSSLHSFLGLYHKRTVSLADGRRTTRHGFLPFVWSWRQTEPTGTGSVYRQSRVTVPPLIMWLKSDNYGSGVTEADFLYPLGHYFRGERHPPDSERDEFAYTFRFLPFWSYERSWRLDPGQGPSGSPGRPGKDGRAPLLARDEAGSLPDGRGTSQRARAGERVRFRLLHFLLGYEREADTGKVRSFVLGGTPGKPGEKHTWALWARERGPSTDYAHQLLWEFYLAKREGSGRLAVTRPGPERPSDMWRATKWLFGGSPRKVVKVGPALSYEADWEADRKEFTLFFGFFSYLRTGGRRRGRLFWVIPWRV